MKTQQDSKPKKIDIGETVDELAIDRANVLWAAAKQRLRLAKDKYKTARKHFKEAKQEAKRLRQRAAKLAKQLKRRVKSKVKKKKRAVSAKIERTKKKVVKRVAQAVKAVQKKAVRRAKPQPRPAKIAKLVRRTNKQRPAPRRRAKVQANNVPVPTAVTTPEPVTPPTDTDAES